MAGRDDIPLVALAKSVVAVGLVAVLDRVTGFEVRLYPLYFVPVAYGAWYAGWSGAVLLAVVSTGSWTVSNWLGGAGHSHAYIWPINIATQGVAMMVVGGLVCEIRRSLLRERELSQRDPLTSLLNRRAFYEQSELLFAMLRRSGQPVALAYIDVDDFKRVNDRGGHEMGDEVLKLLCTALEGNTRETDLIARMGGDEFAVLLVDADGAEVNRVLDRLHTAIATAMPPRVQPVTVSAGAVWYATPPASIADAVRASDELMYRVKGEGKNSRLVEAR